MFNAFERAVAGRYLFSRKSDRFTSVIAIFSFLGIMLGVATLIIVMSVMGGFRQELLGRILGLNGHMGIYAADRGNQTGLLFRQTAGVVPVGTTQAQLVLSMERLSGYDNDGYADNLSFVLSNPQPVPEPAAYGLLLSGLAALSLVRARRRRAD